MLLIRHRSEVCELWRFMLMPAGILSWLLKHRASREKMQDGLIYLCGGLGGSQGFGKGFLSGRGAESGHSAGSRFFAALCKFAVKKGIRYLLTGGNFATESVLPLSWGYDPTAGRHLKAIHRRYGKKKLKSYQTLGFVEQRLIYTVIHRLKIIRPLNYIPCNKDDAKKILQKEFCWKAYRCKHGESRFTKFFQNHYLPHKFGFDKRKAHLSSMILSNTISRDDALQELRKPLYEPLELEEDRDFFIKKLGLSRTEYDEIMKKPPRHHDDYSSNIKTIRSGPPTEACFFFKEAKVCRIIPL